MAKIVHSDLAPDESVHYTLGNVEFDLGKGSTKQSYETNDRSVLGNAEQHPWLDVEYDEAEVIKGEYANQLDPKDDVLSAENSIANDPDKVRAALDSGVDEVQPVAVDAGLDQSKVFETKTDVPVSLTLAADDAANDDKDKN